MIDFSSPYTPRSLAKAGGYFKVMCKAPRCAHEGQVMPQALVEAGHGNVHLDVVARRFKCTRCGAGQPTVGHVFG